MKTKRKNAPSAILTFVSALQGLAASLVTAVLLALILAGVSLIFKDTSKMAKYFGFATLYVSALVGGFFAQKRSGGAPFVTGLLCGTLLFALISVLSYIVPMDFSSGWPPLVSWLLRLPAVALAVFGAFLAEYKPKKRRRR